jgi:hypothetical protein
VAPVHSPPLWGRSAGKYDNNGDSNGKGKGQALNRELEGSKFIATAMKGCENPLANPPNSCHPWAFGFLNDNWQGGVVNFPYLKAPWFVG